MDWFMILFDSAKTASLRPQHGRGLFCWNIGRMHHWCSCFSVTRVFSIFTFVCSLCVCWSPGDTSRNQAGFCAMNPDPRSDLIFEPPETLSFVSCRRGTPLWVTSKPKRGGCVASGCVASCASQAGEGLTLSMGSFEGVASVHMDLSWMFKQQAVRTHFHRVRTHVLNYLKSGPGNRRNNMTQTRTGSPDDRSGQGVGKGFSSGGVDTIHWSVWDKISPFQ